MSLAASSTRRPCALVIGGTSGIGAGMAQALASRQYDVVIAGRSPERGQQVLDQLYQRSSSAASNNTNKKDSGGGDARHEFLALNGFDLKSMKEALLSLKTTTNNNNEKQQPRRPFDVVVLSQGMATLQGYTPTPADGLDEKLQLHYFSRVYACLVLGQYQLLHPENCRVLTVLSAGVHRKYKEWESDFELKQHYSMRNAADAAGFYTDAGFASLAQRFSHVTFAHAAPGFVATAWGSEMPAVLRHLVIRPMQRLFGTTATECGETLTKGLFNLPSRGGFHLMDENGAVIDPANKGGFKHTESERERIWEKTLALLPDV